MTTQSYIPKPEIYGCFTSEKGRMISEEDVDGRFPRSLFQHDRDRIIHSVAFRRLKHKTQVFLYHEGDYFRTRLTHSLEVAQIARTMARALGLNEDIAEAVGLAHDLGHPPFGHIGEKALDEVMSDYGGFDHNEQTIRVLTLLEHRYASFNGLNLSFEAIDGVLKHNGPLINPKESIKGIQPFVIGPVSDPLINKEKDVNGPRQTIIDLDMKWGLDLAFYPTAEAQLANLSDDIAYLSHDFDDALRAGLIKIKQIKDLPVVGPILKKLETQFGELEMSRLTHELTRRLIKHFVEDALSHSQALLKGANPQSVNDIRQAKMPLIGHSDDIQKEIKILRDFLFRYSWRHYKVNRMMSKSKKHLIELFNCFMEESNLLPTDWFDRVQDIEEKQKARIIADYLASMTDRYALLEYERIFEPGPILN